MTGSEASASGEEKRRLRGIFRAARDSMPEEMRAEIDRRIFSGILSLPEYQAAGLILTYVSAGSEVDTRGLIRHALGEGKTVAVPRCAAGRRMFFHRIRSLDALRPSSFGINEPEDDPATRISTQESGLCFLPGLSFDRTGRRLGYGGGYYDRYLAGFTGTKVGLCRAEQLSETVLPFEAHDAAADLVITQTDIIRIH